MVNLLIWQTISYGEMTMVNWKMAKQHHTQLSVLIVNLATRDRPVQKPSKTEIFRTFCIDCNKVLCGTCGIKDFNENFYKHPLNLFKIFVACCVASLN